MASHHASKGLPTISKELIDALEVLWPERSADMHDTHDVLMWRGGQRSVVRKLLDEYRRQTGNLLDSRLSDPQRR